MTSNSQNQNKNSNQSRRPRSQRRRFRNATQRIIDERRSMRQSLSSEREQPSVSISQTHEESSVTPQVGDVQPQFTLTRDAIVQLAATFANADRIGETGGLAQIWRNRSPLKGIRKRRMNLAFLFKIRDR